MSTAASVHLIWERTATRNVEKIVASLDAQSADTVRSELTSTLAVVAGTAEIIRSILFQGTIKADDEVKHEFLFLSLLRARDEMVLAEGLGDERRQAARPAKGHCRAGTPAGGDHASHLERRHAVPLDAARHHDGGRLIVGPTIAACRCARGPSRASRCAMAFGHP
jgi:hypothetical protein